jgi:glutamine amidotransferase
MPTIGLINYGSGNLGSVRNALEHLALETVEIRQPGDLDRATHLILPGVGAFGRAMRQLEQLGLLDALRHQVLHVRKPFLGICVGMQILATVGTEFGECAGLDLLTGRVERIPAESFGVRLPHIGWNDVSVRQVEPLFRGLEEAPDFYFVHSYQLTVPQEGAISATSRYGGEFVAAVQHENLFGVQFHPEKSQRAGLQLLRNFAAVKG